LKITISATNDLVTDQRVHKVCTSLHEAGYTVRLVGRRFRNSRPLEREYRTHRMCLFFNRSFLFYAEYNIRLFFLLFFDRADLFLSNDTDSLPANYLVSRIKRKKLVFDAHEMFPEVPELVNRKFVKNCWTLIENLIFPRLNHSYTVCQSIADVYNERYGINMQVVRNIPFSKETEVVVPAIDKQDKKIILYQGAVNIGRGIEYLIEAMPYLDNCILYIVGDGDCLEVLRKKNREMQLEDKVVFTGRIPFEQLPAYTVCADLGVNILENRGLNYYYALPNRIFDYIRRNTPILANDFPEVRRVISRYEVGTLINRYDPEYLASVIKKIIAEPKNDEGFALANKELSWENESHILLEIIRKAYNS
jgi:Glycosyltransferase